MPVARKMVKLAGIQRYNRPCQISRPVESETEEVMQLKVDAAFWAGRMRDTLPHLRHWLELHPNDASRWQNLANAQDALANLAGQRFEGAEHWADLAVQAEKGEWRAVLALVQALLLQGTATDADQGIALAMISAARVFDCPDYRDRAGEIFGAMRRRTRLEVGAGWRLAGPARDRGRAVAPDRGQEPHRAVPVQPGTDPS